VEDTAGGQHGDGASGSGPRIKARPPTPPPPPPTDRPPTQLEAEMEYIVECAKIEAEFDLATHIMAQAQQKQLDLHRRYIERRDALYRASRAAGRGDEVA